MKKFLLVSIIVLACFPIAALACSCGMGGGFVPKTDAELRDWILGSADYIFVGTVDRFEYRDATKEVPLSPFVTRNPSQNWQRRLATFSIERWWKGDTSPEALLLTGEIVAKNDRESKIIEGCTSIFQVGRRVLVFATKENGTLVSSVCSLASKISEDQLVRYAGEGTVPVKKENKPRVSRENHLR